MQYNSNPIQPLSATGVRVEFQPLMRMVYMWMGLGLLTTAVVGWVVSSNMDLLRIALSQPVLIGSIFVSLGLVFAINLGIRRMSPTVAAVLFFIYAAVIGFTTMAIVLAFYPTGSIVAAFGTTAILFGVMTVIGMTTNVDLSKYSTYFMMGLIGLVIALIVNMFLQSSAFDLLISLFGVVLFTGLTAYDTQKIKELSLLPELQGDGEMTMKLSIIGALTLYLDFINLFLFLLRLFSSRE